MYKQLVCVLWIAPLCASDAPQDRQLPTDAQEQIVWQQLRAATQVVAPVSYRPQLLHTIVRVADQRAKKPRQEDVQQPTPAASADAQPVCTDPTVAKAVSNATFAEPVVSSARDNDQVPSRAFMAQMILIFCANQISVSELNHILKSERQQLELERQQQKQGGNLES